MHPGILRSHVVFVEFQPKAEFHDCLEDSNEFSLGNFGLAVTCDEHL